MDDSSIGGFGFVCQAVFLTDILTYIRHQTTANTRLLAPYDLLALRPTSAPTFALAVTHTVPSPITAHIISIPLTLARLPFHLKHTPVKTVIRNGAVFEIAYAAAIGGDNALEARENWWASAREVARATKGKGLIVASGAPASVDSVLRAAKDVGNL